MLIVHDLDIGSVNLNTFDKCVVLGPKLTQSLKNYLEFRNVKIEDITNDLQELLNINQQNFADEMSKFDFTNNSSLWHLSPCAYWSPLINNLYINYCSEIFLEREFSIGESRLYIITDYQLYKNLRSNLNLRKYLYLKSKYVELFIDKFAWVKSEYHLLKTVIKHTVKFVYYWLIRIFRRHTVKMFNFVAFTWLERSSFYGDSFRSRYLPDLNVIFKDVQGTSIVSLSTSDVPVCVFSKVIANSDLICFYEVLRLADIMKAYCRTRIEKKVFKARLPVSFSTELLSLNDKFRNLIEFYAFSRMSTKYDKIQYVLVPYENQCKDRIPILVRRELGLNYKVIAYQHAHISINNPSYYYPSVFKDFPIVDTIVVKDFIAFNRFKSIINSSILPGGNMNKKLAPDTKLNRGDSVLVVLSYDLISSEHLLSFISKPRYQNLHFMVRTHPDFSEDYWRSAISLRGNISFSNTSIEEFKSLGKIVVHNGTSVILEFINQSFSIYKFRMTAVDLDPLLGTNINQSMFSSVDIFDFVNNSEQYSTCEYHIPFNREAWLECLN